MDQNMNNQIENEITLLDLFRLFVSKWKIIVIAALVLAIIGGVYGGFSSKAAPTYETTISFNLSPSDSTDSLLYNLQSESFAEKLLLEENGLPPVEECNAEDYAAAVEAMKVFEEARAKKAELRLELNRFQTSAVQHEYDRLKDAYKSAYDIWSTYMGVQVSEDKLNVAEIAKYYEQMTVAKDALDKYRAETYEPLMTEKIALQEEYNVVNVNVRELRTKAEDAVEKVVAPWRADEKIQEKIKSIMESVTYEYESLNVPVTTTGTSELETVRNKGYIKISIAVVGDEELADFLLERFKERTPGFVEQHIEEISGTTQAECKLISTFADIEYSLDSIWSGVVKFAVIGGVAGVVLTYAVLALQLIIKNAEQNRKNKLDALAEAKSSDTEN